MPTPTQPRQARLFAPPKNKPQAVTHETRNREAARVILAEPARYGAPDSLAFRWAEAFAARPTSRRASAASPARLTQSSKIFCHVTDGAQ